MENVSWVIKQIRLEMMKKPSKFDGDNQVFVETLMFRLQETLTVNEVWYIDKWYLYTRLKLVKSLWVESDYVRSNHNAFSHK